MQQTLEPAVYSPRHPIHSVVHTAAGDDTPTLNRSSRKVWQSLIDEKLIAWATNPDYFADEDFDGPSRAVLSLALKFAQQLRDANQPPPNRIVPDADGGLVFEITKGGMSEKIHFWDNGDVEYIVIRDGRIADRRPLQLA